MKMPAEFTEITDFCEWQTALEQTAMTARDLLEHVWSPQTAYHGVQVAPADMPSRGQCGVSTLWLSRYLRRHSVDTAFVDGTLTLEGTQYPHSWTEVRHARFGSLVLDLTSDQYKTTDQRPVYVGGHSGVSPEPPYASRSYHSLAYFEPYQVPHCLLLQRFVTLDRKIRDLPLQNQIVE